jgi:hypothetical protein
MESYEHKHLKKIAVIWLLNQGCFLADAEVPLSQVGLIRYSNLDNKTVIDAAGVGLRFSKDNGKSKISGQFDPSILESAEVGECILRGIEVKVTRGDYRTGFACSGCNFHYLLTPLKLLAPSEVPKGVGLIEYNKYKWSCELDTTHPDRPYRITGLRILKHPVYRQIPRFQVDGAIAYIVNRTNQWTRQKAFEEVNNL